jgi:dTDP-4-amino-4,6-dideoxygalactose transaminase
MAPVPAPFTKLAAMAQDVRRDVDTAWRSLLAHGDFVGGAAVERFEQECAEYCGTAHAAADALTLRLRALGIGRGDEVVMPVNTFVATVDAVVLTGATPQFADVDPNTLLLVVALVPDRDAVRSMLVRRGLATTVHYPVPCHRQHRYRRFADRPLPVGEATADRLVSLPLYPHMTEVAAPRLVPAGHQAHVRPRRWMPGPGAVDPRPPAGGATGPAHTARARHTGPVASPTESEERDARQ